MTSQQQADAILSRWQEPEMRRVPPSERIEILMREFFDPPLSDFEYQDVINRVRKEMQDA